MLLGSAYVGWAYYLADRSTGPMLIAGRSDDIANWPENSLPGVQSAARLGADGIEIDIRRSADGTFYLMHDANVDRTTNGTGAIRELHDSEIDALTIDGGLGFNGQSGLTVPRLLDVLDVLMGYDGMLLLDAKGDATEHAALARLGSARKANARISCSTAADVVAVADLIPSYGGIDIGADQDMVESPLPWSAWLRPAQVSAISEGWTSGERDVMDRARRWGVEIYITNHLEAALASSAGG